MGRTLSTDKAIRPLDFRGQKLLVKTLRDCWLEQDVHEDSPYIDMALSTVRVHAPLEEYEFLRNLDKPQADQLIATLKELYSSKDMDVVSVEFELETDHQAHEQLISVIEEQKSVMIAVATGQLRIQEANDEYKKSSAEIGMALQRKGIKDPNRFGDLWAWYNRWKNSDLPSYQSRRQFVSELYEPLIEQLRSGSSSTTGMFPEPTGWARVDRCVTRIREQVEHASNEEQFQVVGTLSREALISLAQAVFDADRHPTVDGVPTSPTDFKRMMEAYFSVELVGESMKHSRQHAKAAFDLANELQHKRTATFRDAALCAEATVAVINLVAIVSGQRDP